MKKLKSAGAWKNDTELLRYFDMILHQFTISDDYGKTMEEIIDMAKASARDQEDFEIQSGGDEWPQWKISLSILPRRGDTRRYHVDVVTV